MFNFNKFAQMGQGYGGSASVPGQVPGAENIPLNDLAQQQQQQGQNFSPAENNQTGANIENVKDLLNEIIGNTNPDITERKKIQSDISNIKGQVQDPAIATQLHNLEGAIASNSNPDRLTRDLTTGEEERSAQDLAQDILDLVENMENKKQDTAEQNITTAAKKSPANEYAPKKKTRGNPFRVLMGQVGKLLDHGMNKRDIIKYLLRKKYWGEDMISKAVDIVKDYNKKKKRKPAKKEASFNLNKYAQMIDTNETELANKIPFKSDNDAGITPDWTKRSTAELFARIQWLNSLRAYASDTHRETDDVADIKGAATQQKQIKTELKKRGFTAKEIG